LHKPKQQYTFVAQLGNVHLSTIKLSTLDPCFKIEVLDIFFTAHVRFVF